MRATSPSPVVAGPRGFSQKTLHDRCVDGLRLRAPVSAARATSAAFSGWPSSTYAMLKKLRERDECVEASARVFRCGEDPATSLRRGNEAHWGSSNEICLTECRSWTRPIDADRMETAELQTAISPRYSTKSRAAVRSVRDASMLVIV